MKEKLINQCRYYKGEEECPESLKAMQSGELCWFYEMKWVEFNEEDNRMCSGERLLDEVYLREYNAYGMSDFSIDDGVPTTLKALLFNRYYHGGYVEMGGTAFRYWYMENYLRKRD